MHMRDKKRLHNLTEENYQKMMKVQGGVCAICGQPNGLRGLFIDRDPVTEQVRGLLCTRCNAWLAAIEDAGFVERASAYLLCPPASQLGTVELDPLAKDLPGWKKRG